MTIFENQKEEWLDKVNFVDKNNVVVGFDTTQNCCENAGWFINKEKCNEIKEDVTKVDVSDFVFDENFFQEASTGEEFDVGGGMVIFRLINEKGDELFLHLYNVHNGYYGHGFEVTISGKTIKDGSL